MSSFSGEDATSFSDSSSMYSVESTTSNTRGSRISVSRTKKHLNFLTIYQHPNYSFISTYFMLYFSNTFLLADDVCEIQMGYALGIYCVCNIICL